MFRFLFNSAMRALRYAHEIRGLVTSRGVRFNSSRFYDARRRRLLLNAILAACIAFFLGFISPNDAAAEETLVTDIYIAVPPAGYEKDGNFFYQLYYSDAGHVLIPKSAFTKSDIIPFNDKFDGAKDLRTAIDKSLATANKQFEKAGVKFEVRNIYFVSGKNKHIKDSFISEDHPYFDLGLKHEIDPKTKEIISTTSTMLNGFEKLTEKKTDSINILLAPLNEGDTSIEMGWAATPGNNSIIDLGSSNDPRDNGFIMIHELGHSLGLGHRNGANPFNTAMSPNMPNRGEGEASKVANPVLTADDISTIKANVTKGKYKNYVKPEKKKTKKSTETSLLTPSESTNGALLATNGPVNQTVPVSLAVPAALPSAASGTLVPVSTAGTPLQTFWFQPEIEIKFGKVFYYDGYPPHYGRFSGTDTPVIEGDDDLDPICGAFDAKAPVQVGGFNLRLSGWGMLCDGDTSTSRNDFTPGTNFDIDQPGNGVQAGIPGNVPFNISARSEYTSVRGTLGVGGVLAQNGYVLFTGEVLFGAKTSESESEGKFQSDAFAGGFQTTSTQKIDETTFGVGYRGEYVWSPNGVNVPDTGLQTVSVSVLGGVNFQDIDGSDRFFSTEGANVLGDVRRSLSANKNTFYYGVEGSVRIGTGGGTAVTFTGFYNSDEMAFVELDFDGPSRIEFDRVDYAGVMAKFTVPLSMPGLTQSDARLKTDIKHLTTLENGLKLYAFKYLWDETVQVGLMAQDLLVDDTHKSAVVTMANGFYAVDYRSLGLKMATMDQWQARGVTAVMY